MMVFIFISRLCYFSFILVRSLCIHTTFCPFVFLSLDVCCHSLTTVCVCVRVYAAAVYSFSMCAHCFTVCQTVVLFRNKTFLYSVGVNMGMGMFECCCCCCFFLRVQFVCVILFGVSLGMRVSIFCWLAMSMIEV